jgi:DNA processing protein
VTGAPGDPGRLRAAVLDLLDRGATPDDLLLVRRQLGHDAGRAAVVAGLARRLAAPALDRTAPAPVDPAHVRVSGVDMPARLAATWDVGGPLWIHVRGALPPDGAPAVAVVGTRHPTLDGATLARDLATDLAAAGVVVVSGMARGVDQAAHRGALAGGGRTTAVLGTGHGVDYPAGSGRLRADVAASGGLVTEHAAGAGVRRPTQFLARNRILAGLADAVVVVEAGARSGALSTARSAAEQGRDVLVVPSSPRNAAAAGSLALLVDGATPVRHAADVLDALGHVGAAAATPHDVGVPCDLSPVGAAIWPLIGTVPASPSRLAEVTGHPARAVLVALSELEAAGVVHRDGAGVVRT